MHNNHQLQRNYAPNVKQLPGGSFMQNNQRVRIAEPMAEYNQIKNRLTRSEPKLPDNQDEKSIEENVSRSVIKSNVNPVIEKLKINTTRFDKNKKVIFRRIRKKLGLKNKSEKAVTMKKKGMYCSVFDIDEK